MDYKEKYEQALERCKKEFNFNNLAYSHEEIKQKLKCVFPELKESEDERIRKELIEFVKSRGGFKQEYIAWLEKQGEKVDVIENFDTEFEKQVSHLIASTINKEHEYNKGFVKWTANILLNYAKHELEKQGESCYPYQPGWRKNYSGNKPKVKHSVLMLTTHGIAEGEWLGEEWCQYKWSCKVKDTEVLYWMHLSDLENLEKENEKQGEQKPTNKCIGCNNFKGCITCTDGDQYAHITEQKPTDKVKPKFHEGEWITNGDYTWKIVEVKPLDYILQSQEGNIVDDTISHVDEQFHSFTIKDAKDGDVLVTHLSPEGDWIGIYKESVDILGFKTYCFLNATGEFVINPNRCRNHGTYGLHPATKEQRDLLFQKMKEAGYEWDAEKKELKKIEQKLANKIEPKFKVGDLIYHEKSSNTFRINKIEYGLYVSVEGATISLGRQNDWRLWTIQDAKNGDVLVWNDCGDEYIFVFDKLIKDYIHAFIGFNVYLGTIETKEDVNRYYQLNKLYPATKEQCDLLFQKMKEAGYEFDSGKK